MTHDTAFAPHTDFPQLPLVTDCQAMRDLLQRQLPGFADGHLRIDAVSMLLFQHKAGKRCRLCYQLRVRDLHSGERGIQLLSGLIEPQGGAKVKYDRALHAEQAQPAFGPALHYIEELQMALWGFPNDPALPSLYRLFAPETLPQVLTDHWQSLYGPDAVDVTQVTTTLVKYVPRKRCTLRHTLTRRDGDDLVLYSKMFKDRQSAERTFATMQTLWQASVETSDAFVIPEPLGIEPQMHAVFVRGLHAANADALVATLPLDRLGKEVGVSLARLHQCPLTGLDLWTPEDVMTRAMQAAKRLERFDTAYTVPVQMIIHALEERSATHSAIAVTPIHGAFRLSQVLLTNGRCAIIDFDDVKRGNPLIDVASFVAHLLYVQVKGQLSQAQSQVAIQHFCRAYAAHVPWTVDGDVLAWYIAAHVVGQHAEKCLRLAKQNAHAKVVQLLHLAVDLLGKSNDET